MHVLIVVGCVKRRRFRLGGCSSNGHLERRCLPSLIDLDAKILVPFRYGFLHLPLVSIAMDVKGGDFGMSEQLLCPFKEIGELIGMPQEHYRTQITGTSNVGGNCIFHPFPAIIETIVLSGSIFTLGRCDDVHPDEEYVRVGEGEILLTRILSQDGGGKVALMVPVLLEAKEGRFPQFFGLLPIVAVVDVVVAWKNDGGDGRQLNEHIGNILIGLAHALVTPSLEYVADMNDELGIVRLREAIDVFQLLLEHLFFVTGIRHVTHHIKREGFVTIDSRRCEGWRWRHWGWIRTRPFGRRLRWPVRWTRGRTCGGMARR